MFLLKEQLIVVISKIFYPPETIIDYTIKQNSKILLIYFLNNRISPPEIKPKRAEILSPPEIKLKRAEIFPPPRMKLKRAEVYFRNKFLRHQLLFFLCKELPPALQKFPRLHF